MDAETTPHDDRLTTRQVLVVLGLLAILVGSLAIAYLADQNRLVGTAHPWNEPGPLIINHEGLEGPGLERTDLGAFRLAVDAGFDRLETDARLTLVVNGEDPDAQVLVALHDVGGAVEQFDASEVGSEDRMATIEELLEGPEFAGVHWNFEFKAADAYEAATVLAEVMAAANDPTVLDRVCLSFGDIKSQDTVGRIRDLFPVGSCFCASFPERSAMFDSLFGRGLTSFLRVSTGHPISCIQVLHNTISAKDVAQAHDAGLKIHVWELALPAGVGSLDAERMRELLCIGVDGIITYDRETLRQVIEVSTPC